jgi:DNA mismatch repair protein PMS2
MAGSIKAIDKGAVHRICSGQVVLDLATCVKEIVENSLDAGASTLEVRQRPVPSSKSQWQCHRRRSFDSTTWVLQIRLRDHGAGLIEIADDGKGVEPADYKTLAAKYESNSESEDPS